MNISEIQQKIEAIKTQLSGDAFNITLQMELAQLEISLEDLTQ